MLRLFLRRRSYYTRFFVPLTLHAILERAELWRSLNTRSYALAKVRAGIMAGRVSTLFLHLAQNGHRMTSTQITALVNKYLDTTLEAGEDDRALKDHITEAERDSQIEGLSVGIDLAHEALTTNNLTKVHEIADGLLAGSGLHLEQTSVEYRRLCRELLRAQITVFD